MEEIKINPSGDETQEQGLNQEQGQAQGQKPVSYTHLTLPTN